MKILHTSDLHLGFYLNGLSFHQWQDELAQQFINVIKKHNVDTVIIAGDLFDRSVTNEEAVSVYDRIITTLSQHARHVVIIAGNHDSAVRLSVLEGVLEQSGIYITGKLGDSVKSVVIDDVTIYTLPYFTADDVRYLYADETEQIAIEEQVKIRTLSYSDMVGIVVNDVKKTFVEGQKNLLVTHCYITSDEVASDEVASDEVASDEVNTDKNATELSESDKTALILGKTQEVKSSVFEGFDYVAAGHLHRSQRVKPNVYYSGSPLPYSFGETVNGGVKTVNIYDTNSAEIIKEEISTSLTLRQINGELDDILAIATDENKLDYLKIVLTDRYVTIEVYNQIKEAYPNVLVVEGKTFEMKGGGQTLSLHSGNLNDLSPKEVIEAFLNDYTDIELDEELLELSMGDR